MSLNGIRVLVTRARTHSDELSKQLEAWGAKVLHCPMIEISPPESYAPLDNALRNIASYDWIIFTSKNAVQAVLSRIKELGKEAFPLSGLKILPVGAATATALEKAGLSVTLVPEKFRAEGAIESLKNYFKDDALLAQQRFLFPRAAQGRELIVSELTRLGAKVDLIEAYRTVAPAGAREKLLEILNGEPIDAVAFTSPSTILNTAEMIAPEPLAEALKDCAVACIGPVTAAAALECGLEVAICPKDSTAAALAQSIKDHFDSILNY